MESVSQNATEVRKDVGRKEVSKLVLDHGATWE